MTDFQGFEPSNTTPVPDILFDELLPELTGAELKILLYIIRRTWGFKKATDAISLTQLQDGIITRDGKQLDKGCGIKRRETICQALASLEKKNCIKSQKGIDPNGDKATNIYGIYFKEVVSKPDYIQVGGSFKTGLPVVSKPDYGSPITGLGVVSKPDIQETVSQETVSQDTILAPELTTSSLAIPKEPIPFPEKPKRKPAKEKDTGLQARITQVYECFDTLLQEVSEDSTARYSRTRKATEAIKEFLACNPTSENLRKVYLDLWNTPATNGFCWRDNMSIPAICNNYDKRLLALRGRTLPKKKEEPKQGEPKMVGMYRVLA